jgi:hypothetical protein
MFLTLKRLEDERKFTRVHNINGEPYGVRRVKGSQRFSCSNHLFFHCILGS